MALVNYYPDEYLRTHVTEPREARAAAEVADLGVTHPAWAPRLTILRAYMIVCLECQREPDDLFSTKLGAYRREFDAALLQARQAQASASAASGQAMGGSSLFSMPVFRA